MSLRQNQTFASELEAMLQGADLPTDLYSIIGRLYRFGCEHGSHHTILCGTIQAIKVSDEGGLELYVSNPLFWGERLISIKHSNGKWIAFVDDLTVKFFEGEFELL